MVTTSDFENYLNCPLKAWKSLIGIPSTSTELSSLWQERQTRYVKACVKVLESKHNTTCFHDFTIDSLPDFYFTHLFNCEVHLSQFSAQIHCIEFSESNNMFLVPTRFVNTEKVTKHHKMLLGLDALALSKISGQLPKYGRIIHGSTFKTAKVLLQSILPEVEQTLNKLISQKTSISPPPLVLNKHCGECAYQQTCKQEAVQRDDLSLITSMTLKERNKFHEKGIFSITQLSYTYRPRRQKSLIPTKKKIHSHSLKALAIRENKVHVVDKPDLAIAGNPVYIDVEGIPDQDFYYLIGLRYGLGDYIKSSSFWADDVGQEGTIWYLMLDELGSLDTPQLIHFGSYEKQFFDNMRQRYGSGKVADCFLDNLQATAINIVSVLYAQIYFPTYSNGLKDIANFIGFNWTDASASGINSLLWRFQWETFRNQQIKNKLQTYNAEDCEALEVLTQFVSHLTPQQTQTESLKNEDVVHTEDLKPAYPFQLSFGKNNFVFPEFDYINSAAYWDYQHEKVYFRTTKKKRRKSTKSVPKNKRFRINKTTYFESKEELLCLKCGSSHIVRNGSKKKTIYDLKFGEGSIKRWVEVFIYSRYRCQSCGNANFSNYLPWSAGKYGWNLFAYIFYSIVDIQLSQGATSRNIHKLFGFSLGKSNIGRIKSEGANYYSSSYQALLDNIKHSHLVHADETRISLKNGYGYTWVLSTFDEVVYFYTDTREGTELKKHLNEFKGVLVSDFYSVYDSIDCPQQKCLIHLMRDMNDALHKDPFNSELKTLVQSFASLLKPMIETVDRFGLKTYFLRKYKEKVQRFYQELFNQDYQSQTAIKLVQRFTKNQNKLFTFLDYDGVPWNNNNAEHAIKAFAALRKPLRGLSTDKGMKEYLILLSIRETCKLRDIDFLDFLRSKERSLKKSV